MECLWVYEKANSSRGGVSVCRPPGGVLVDVGLSSRWGRRIDPMLRNGFAWWHTSAGDETVLTRYFDVHVLV